MGSPHYQQNHLQHPTVTLMQATVDAKKVVGDVDGGAGGSGGANATVFTTNGGRAAIATTHSSHQHSQVDKAVTRNAVQYAHFNG